MIHHFCSLPLSLVLEAGLSRWNKLELTLQTLSSLPGITLEQHQAVIQTVCDLWNPHSRMKLRPASGADLVDIRMSSGLIDGRGGTLAWSELPSGADAPLRQMYDTSEHWSAALKRAQLPAGMFPLVVTMAHEVGHALGMGHSNDPGALMYPTLNINAWGPQAWDIRELVARYGQPEEVPTPPSGPRDDRVMVIPSRREIVVPAGQTWTVRQRAAQGD